jgi:hypothetical protein
MPAPPASSFALQTAVFEPEHSYSYLDIEGSSLEAPTLLLLHGFPDSWFVRAHHDLVPPWRSLRNLKPPHLLTPFPLVRVGLCTVRYGWKNLFEPWGKQGRGFRLVVPSMIGYGGTVSSPRFLALSLRFLSNATDQTPSVILRALPKPTSPPTPLALSRATSLPCSTTSNSGRFSSLDTTGERSSRGGCCVGFPSE